MSEEEIQKALEIIKQPITVNCEDYHYFDQENYDKLVAVYDNCLWFIRNFEQINTTVERVQQENQQLKEDYKRMKENFDSKVDVITKYKEVIEELREELSEIDDDIIETCKIYDVNGIKLKKILDKVKEI